MNTNGCIIQPCVHDGNYINMYNRYACLVPGFGGVNRADDDECASGPCANSGLCRDSEGRVGNPVEESTPRLSVRFSGDNWNKPNDCIHSCLNGICVTK